MAAKKDRKERSEADKAHAANSAEVARSVAEWRAMNGIVVDESEAKAPDVKATDLPPLDR